MLRSWQRAVFLIFIGLALVACSGEGESASEATPTPTAVTLPRALMQTPATQPARAATVAVDTPTPSTEPGEEPGAPVDAPLVSLPGLNVGLETLESYRIVATIDFVGSGEGGKPEQWQATFREETARSSDARHLQISTTESGDKPIEFYVIGDTLYQLDGEGEARTCNAITSDMVGQSASLTQPSVFLLDLEMESLGEMKLVGRGERIDDIAADRYRIDHSIALPGGDVAVKGDVWVAQPGGYVARFLGSWSGVTGSLMEVESTGVFTMEYGIEAVNALPTIDLPVECSGVVVETQFPLPDNAQNTVIMADMVMFSSPDAPESVAAFYRDAMPVAGWSLAGEQQAGDALMLDFSRGEERAAVTISPQESGTSVLIAEP